MPLPTFESVSVENPTIFDCAHLMVHRDLSNLHAIMDEFGVAIVPALLSEEECESALSHTHGFFVNLMKDMPVPFNPADSKTYRTLADVSKLHSMLFQGYGVGQNQGSWEIRQNPKVFEVFSSLWHDDDLLTSMDGLSYQVPPERMPAKGGPDATNRAGYFQHTWFHCDQSFERNERECVQGQVNLIEVTPGDATLMVLEGSHRLHGAFRERFGAASSEDWQLLESRGNEKVRGSLSFFTDKHHCPMRRITCPRGSLILWDSRTIHCGSEPLRLRPNAHWRVTIYVCMTPAYLCTQSNMDKRIEAFEELATTSHWPHRVKIFPTLAQGRFVLHPPQLNLSLSYPVLSPLGLQLLIGKERQHAGLEPRRAGRSVEIAIGENGRPMKKSKGEKKGRGTTEEAEEEVSVSSASKRRSVSKGGAEDVAAAKKKQRQRRG